MSNLKQHNFWHLVSLILFREDCLVIPGFGGFVLHYDHAHADPVSNLIYPADRKLGFNARLQMNDGVLATRLGKLMDLNTLDTFKLIETEVKKVNEILDREGSFNAASIGVFSLGENRSLTFTPHPGLNFYSGSFGLKPLKAELKKSPATKTFPLRNNGPAIPDIKDLPLKVIPKPKRTKATAFTFIATGLTLVLLANALFFLNKNPLSPLEEKLSEMNMAGKVTEVIKPQPKPEEVKPAVKEEPAQTAVVEQPVVEEAAPVANSKPVETVVETPVTETAPEIDYAAWALNLATARHVEASIAEAPATTAMEVPVEPAPAPATGEMHYFIVGGSFKVDWRAKRFQKDIFNDGFIHSSILTHQRYPGLMLVSYEAYAGKEEALKRLADVQENFNAEAWLLEN